MRIACLHAAESNIATFEAAARELGLAPGALRHEIRADLLAAAEEAGGLTPRVASETAAVLLGLSHDADAVLLTCSMLGPSIDPLRTETSVPVLRADGALADQAVQAAGRVIVLCAIEASVEPTARLFSAAAERTSAQTQVRLVPGAWELFRQGDIRGYLGTIAAAADEAYGEGATLVVLGQASMAGASGLVTGGPAPLSTPHAGLAAAIAAVHRQRTA
jgi:hypothetical protein